MKSARQVAPAWERHVLVIDEESRGEGRAEPFTAVTLDELAHEHPRTLVLRYSAAEAMAALKPWLVRRVFELGFDRVLCLDAALRLVTPLAELDDALSGGAFLALTPHPNLGFFGVARHASVLPFLDWCQRKLTLQGPLDLDHGFFSTSRWVDIAAGQFGNIVRLAHPGYDAGLRTLTTRRFDQADGGWRVDGQPLRAFHFGGLGLGQANGQANIVRPLVEAYYDDLAECDRRACERLSYRYASFADGSPIPPVFRELYAARPDSAEMFGPDPFTTMPAILEMPFGAGRPPLTILVRLFWEHSAPLRARFPHPHDGDRAGLARAFLDEIAPRHGIPDRYLQTIRDGLATQREVAERQAILDRMNQVRQERSATTPAAEAPQPASWWSGIAQKLGLGGKDRRVA